MIVPTTPGKLGRVARGSLAALLAIAAVALTATLASAGSQAAAHPADRSASRSSAEDCAERTPILVTRRGRWRCQNMYMARVALDGRKHPNDSRRGAEINKLRAGEWVNIRCQITGAGGRLYDRVGDHFVPDEYMRTLYTGRIPGSPTCRKT